MIPGPQMIPERKWSRKKSKEWYGEWNGLRTLKFKGQPTKAFFATVNQRSGGSSQLPTMLTELGPTIWFDYCALDSSGRLGGAAKHLIDGSEKSFCRLTFELKSPHVIERRSNARSAYFYQNHFKSWLTRGFHVPHYSFPERLDFDQKLTWTQI